MTYQRKSYLEHVAIPVKDIHWHIRFFREVFGMTLREVDGDPSNPKQVWTIGGIQLMASTAFDGPEGRLAHLGIMTEDLDAALAEARAFGAKDLPRGRNWLQLPDGLCIEVIQAAGQSVREALAVAPRA
jgi:predicted enzyme related to lactoylglutathione lyase